MLITKILTYLHKLKNRASLEKKIFTYENQYIDADSFTYPFKYSVIDNFLDLENYEKIVNYYKKLKLNYKENFGYAKIYNVNTAKVPYEEFPFLYDSKFYEFIKKVSNVDDLSTDVAATMHHNTPTEKDKYIHSDFSVVLSRDDYTTETFLKNIDLDNDYKVNFFLTDNKSYNKNEYSQLKRKLTAIYYFDNESEDMGGETGIFVKDKNLKDYTEVDAVKCKNNRLLIFENNEHSFHNYKKCSLLERSCIAMWFHVK
jgi:hypothetical protein